MKIAISSYQNMVASTFDFSNEITVLFCVNGEIKSQQKYMLTGQFMPLRAQRLKELDIEILICGAISNHVSVLIQHQKIQIINGISGSVKTIISAFLGNSLDSSQHMLPGFKNTCYKKMKQNRRRFRGGK